MAVFDSTSKKQVQENPGDFVKLCFGLRNITVEDLTSVELISPELPDVDMHQADVLIKVKFRGKFVLVHFEFQTTDSFDPPMALRMAVYIILLIETYKMDVYSTVVYLRPDAGRNDPGKFEQNIPGNQVLVEYEVVRLADMDGQQVLDAKVTGLIPFTPLMKRPADVDEAEWLRRCIQTADSVDVPDKPAYLGGMAMLGNLVYEKEQILEMLRRHTMHESDLYQHWGEQAERKRALEDILRALELRLRPETARLFKPSLERIDDMQRLDELFSAAILADSADDFRKVLDATRN